MDKGHKWAEGCPRWGCVMRGTSKGETNSEAIFSGHTFSAKGGHVMLDNIEFQKKIVKDNAMLIKHISEQEVKENVWNCESNKSSGPDKYNFRFIKAFWEELKVDVVNVVQDFA